MIPQALPVSTVVSFLREMLEGSEFFSDLWIVGEVSNYSRSQLGHRYFSLKDQHALLRAVLFRDSMPGAHLRDGDRVLAHGRVTIYPQRGELQFVCDFVRPEGIGIHAARFEQLREKLEKEGLFEVARKRPLPRFPRRIGLVTSPTGAALQDIRNVIARRWPLGSLVVAPAMVQGEQAASQLLEALEGLAREPGLDLAIIARGGGSAEDLSPFNDEGVARAVFAFPVPVVSGVGHETDLTITDLVSDVRAPTPSAAAERATPDVVEVRRALAAYARVLGSAAGDAIARRGRGADAMFGRIARSCPDTAGLGRQVDLALALMGVTIQRTAHADRVRIEAAGARLAALDPRATLARGFAIVEKLGSRRTVVSSVRKVRAGDRLGISVSDGGFFAEVS